MAAERERAAAPRRGEASEHSASGAGIQLGPHPGNDDRDGRTLGPNHGAGNDPSHPSGGRAHDALPSSVARFEALLTVVEQHGLLARATAIRSGDLGVNLAPAGPPAPKLPERDPFKEGDKAKEEFDDLQYGSS